MAAGAIFHHSDRVTLRQLDAHLGAGDREELRLAAFHSYSSSDEQLWAALPVVRRCWRPIGTLAAKMMRGEEMNNQTSWPRWVSPMAADRPAPSSPRSGPAAHTATAATQEQEEV